MPQNPLQHAVVLQHMLGASSVDKSRLKGWQVESLQTSVFDLVRLFSPQMTRLGVCGHVNNFPSLPPFCHLS